MPALLDALQVTVIMSILACALGMPLGLLLAILRGSRFALVRNAAWLFVDFIRGTPLLLQLYFLYYAFPHLNITLSATLCGVVGLGVYCAAYTSEVFRAGIDRVPVGQREAARVLHLPARYEWQDVIIPQALRYVLPALGNYVIVMFKYTPYLSVITIPELLSAALYEGDATYRYTEPLTIACVLFIAVSLPAAYLLRRIEHRMGQVTV